MSVLFYFGVYARIGGIEEFTFDLAMAIRDAGMDVRLVCAAPRHPALQRMEEAGINVCRMPVYHGCRLGLPDYALLPLALRVMREVDVVIHQKPFKRSFYRLFPQGPKHVCITAYRPAEQFPQLPDRRDYFSLFSHVFTQTPEFMSDIRAAGSDVPVEVLPYIPPVVQKLESNESISSRVLRVGMMGRLEPQKNPLYALEIVSVLKREFMRDGCRVEFNIYGGGSLEEPVREAAAKHHMDVVFHGAYLRSDVPGIIAQNDLFIISSDSEGQCIVALEILAGGRPLFATPVGALPVILSKNERGSLLPLDDAGTAAHCINRWWRENRHDRGFIQQSYQEDYDRKQIEQEYVSRLLVMKKAT